MAGGAAAATALVQELLQKRTRHVEVVITNACSLAGFNDKDLQTWVQTSGRHAAFVAEGIDAAWAALDESKLRTLSFVLADGFIDEARLDLDQLLLQSRRVMEAGHVTVLDFMSRENPRWEKDYEGDRSRWYRPELRDAFPLLGVGLDSILATLSQLGCIDMTAGGYGPPSLLPTDFGRECLRVIRAGGDGHQTW